MIPSAVSSGKVHSVFPNSTDADFDFARSSTATRVNSDGLIESVASGQARLNYEIEGGLVNTKPSLLLEPQGTNLIPYSNPIEVSGGWQIFDNASEAFGTAGDLIFYHGATRVVMADTGEVGIGTTNPGAELDIQNSSEAHKRLESGGSRGRMVIKF